MQQTASDNGADGLIDNASDLMRVATYAAVGVAVFLIVIKSIALAATGSVSMMGSLLDSFLDSLASLINLVAVRHALTPADQEHRFGHGKAEALAGLGQAVFIIGSAMFLLFQSFGRLLEPAPVQGGVVGISVSAIAIAATLALLVFQRRVVARSGSLAILADSIHYKGDLLLNLSVILALVLSTGFGLIAADAVFGVAIAAYIGHSAWAILRNANDQLMDREFPDIDREAIKALVLKNPDVISLHDLRTRASGVRRFIQLHLEMDPHMTLLKAHEVADSVELELLQEFPGAEVLIHQDPAGLEDPHSSLSES
jgi:ferrous-iron efflux pump FieF